MTLWRNGTASGSMAGGRRSCGPTAALIRLLAVLPLACLLGGPAPALAQERPRSILDFLFGGPPVRRPAYLLPEDGRPRRSPDRIAPPRRTAPKRSEPAAVSRTVPRAAVSPAPLSAEAVVSKPDADPTEPAIEKSATAKPVLVVGDFMAASLASALVDTFAENADVIVTSAADGSSGFVRDDHYDWPNAIGPLIEEKKPAVVVAMIGSNDRQPIATPDGGLPLRSEAWIEEYQRRMDAFARTIAEKGVALVWVGMPSFKSDRMSDDMAAFNELYRRSALAVGGQFIDVWDGFVDADGAFSFSGPDIAGQQARLRNSDGITLTPQGREKLAFFAEKALFKLLGTTAEGNSADRLTSPAQIAASPAARIPDKTSRAEAPVASVTSVPAIGLDDTALDGDETLLLASPEVAASVGPRPEESKHRDRLVIAGSISPVPRGRADDFDWSARTTEVQAVNPAGVDLFRGTVNLQDEMQAGESRPPKPAHPSIEDAILDDWSRQKKQPPKTRPTSSASAAPAAETPR